MIDNKNITVVIQGPVVSSNDRAMDEGITQKAISSIRHNLPGSTIILSTWHGQPIEGLDIDELVLNDDPGGNIIEYNTSGKPVFVNENRQIVSTKNGLHKVTTEYAIKLRSDNFLSSDNFKAMFEKYKKRASQYELFEERVVINSMFTREVSRGFATAFHPSDFFYFGKTNDLLKLWDLPLFDDYKIDHTKLGCIQYHGYPYYRLSCEQRIFLSALKNNFGIEHNINHLNDTNRQLTEISKLTFANNFIVASAKEIGLGLCYKFESSKRQKQKADTITYLDYAGWKRLYNRHCDNTFDLEEHPLLSQYLKVKRLLLISPKAIQSWFRVFKRKLFS